MHAYGPHRASSMGAAASCTNSVSNFLLGLIHLRTKPLMAYKFVTAVTCAALGMLGVDP